MQRSLVNVYLGGKLGKLFGAEWKLMVSSPAEAIRAIDVNARGKFRDYLFKEGKNRYYKVCLQSKDKTLGATELGMRSGNSDIYILPTVKGKNSGAAKILIGVVLVAAVIFAPELGALYSTTFETAAYGSASASIGAASAGAAFGVGSVAGGIIAGVGVSLVLGGISQLLAPHKNANGTDLGSNYFQGTVAEAAQGGCVAVVYGKALVSPAPISIWSNNVNYDTTANTYQGVQEAAQIPGGGIEYTPMGSSAVGGSTSS